MNTFKNFTQIMFLYASLIIFCVISISSCGPSQSDLDDISNKYSGVYKGVEPSGYYDVQWEVHVWEFEDAGDDKYEARIYYVGYIPGSSAVSGHGRMVVSPSETFEGVLVPICMYDKYDYNLFGGDGCGIWWTDIEKGEEDGALFLPSEYLLGKSMNLKEFQQDKNSYNFKYPIK